MEQTSFSMAQRMLDAAICAYNVDKDIRFLPKAKFWHPIGIDASKPFHHFVSGFEGVNAGFVGVTHDNWLVVSLRGTLPSTHGSIHGLLAFLDDWWQDSKTEPVKFHLGQTMTGHVAKGFYVATLSLWHHIYTAIQNVDAKVGLSKLQGVQITGHSKGAAMTYLCAALVRAAFPAIGQYHIHAYASPLAGQPDFANWFKGQLGRHDTVTRYQRENDIVPFLPPSQSWNLISHLPNSWLGNALWAASIAGDLYGGYDEIGEVVYLPNPASTAAPLSGRSADTQAQAAIIAAISDDHLQNIGEAHSAVSSYWPGIFRQKADFEDIEMFCPFS